MPQQLAPTPQHAATPAPAQQQRSFGRAVRDIVLFSLCVSATAAVAALLVAAVTDARWSLVFVILRWVLVAALLITPLLHQAAVRLGVGFPMPWALRTPATALVLTIESIAFDILSAQLG